MEPNMWNSFGGMALVVVSLIGVAAIVFASAIGLYQRYKQNRYWATCEVDEYYPPGEASAEKLPEAKLMESEIRYCCPKTPANGPEYLEWRPDELKAEKKDAPAFVDNPEKLPMPKGYDMEAEMYKHSRAAEDMGFAKMNTEMAEAMEEAKLIDSNMKRLREIIREEVSIAMKLSTGEIRAARAAAPSLDALASEYEMLPLDDLESHARAVVKALKARKLAKDDAKRDIVASSGAPIATQIGVRRKSKGKSKSKRK